MIGIGSKGGQTKAITCGYTVANTIKCQERPHQNAGTVQGMRNRAAVVSGRYIMFRE